MFETSLLSIAGVIVFVFLAGIRVVNQTCRAVVETFGKFSYYCEPGFHWIVPVFQSMITVNVTEMMSSIEPQEIITKDNLNARVDLVIYYKIKPSDKDVKSSLYNVNDYESQIIMLARTTARNVIGSMMFKDVNSKRQALNKLLADTLDKETNSWGIEVVRVELKEITPPEDVQETMNKVLKANNEKESAVDFATARETEADGIKRAKIKEAEGLGQGKIIVAKAQAEAIKLVNLSANKYFKGNAQKLKSLEVSQEALKNNSKIVLGADGKSVLKLFDLGK